MTDALEMITSAVLDAIARGAPVDAVGLTFLLRQYQATDRDDLRDSLGPALAAALTRHLDDQTTIGRAAWLTLFHDAAALSDDERLREAGGQLVAALAREWPAGTSVDESAASIDACLRAADLGDPHTLIPVAVDELERVVGGAYRPGEGIAHRIGGAAREDGGADDHVRAAAALLTAYHLTARLPYPMLAEELMRFAAEHAPTATGFTIDCEAARVLCRLGALHDDPDYQRAAILAPDADYRRDAEQILQRWSPTIADRGAAAAIYGLALAEWRASRRLGGDAP